MRTLLVLETILLALALTAIGWLVLERRDHLLEHERVERELAALAASAPTAAAARDVVELMTEDELDQLVDSLIPRIEAAVARRAGVSTGGGDASTVGTAGPMTAAGATVLADFEQLEVRMELLEANIDDLGDPQAIARDIMLVSRMPSGETVDEFLDRRIAEHLLGGGRDRPGEPTPGEEPGKRHLADLVTALALEPAQEISVREAIDAGKAEIFELLSRPRQDGGNFTDDLVALFVSGEHPEDEAVNAMFLRAFSEPMPGTTETFGAAFLRTQSATQTRVREHLQDNQREALDQMSIDLLDLDTGFDPMREHVMEKLGQQER